MRTTGESLADFLLGGTRAKLLTALCSKPNAQLFLRELSRNLAISVGTVQRELAALAAYGLVLRVERGNQVFYSINQSHPITPELISLLRKTSGLYFALREVFESFKGVVQYAAVYGSFAKGTETPESDVDLLILGSLKVEDLLEKLAPLEQQLGRMINPTIYSPEEFQTKLRSRNHFLNSVQKGQLHFLLGNEDEFRAIR